jgi:hypothetical protein
MFYVIVNNNRVVFGPREWNRLLFQSVIQDDFDVNATLNFTNDYGSKVVIDENISILPVHTTKSPEYNSLTQNLVGPTWEFDDAGATQIWNVQDKNLEELKISFKNQIKENRYIKEVSGTTIVVGDQKVYVPTDRNSNAIYHQKANVVTDEPVNFKLNATWFSLTQKDFQSICTQIDDFIQSTFDWEKTISDIIDATTDKNDLLKLNLTYSNSLTIAESASKLTLVSAAA